jgi:hypothetical protein
MPPQKQGIRDSKASDQNNGDGNVEYFCDVHGHCVEAMTGPMLGISFMCSDIIGRAMAAA